MSSTRHEEHVLDVAALKALAHPLRTRLWDALMSGPATASQLGQLLGESSGATSYHLRQLARHGFIEEVPDRGTARERFWRATERETRITRDAVSTPSGRAALAIFGDEWLKLRFESAARYQQMRRQDLVPGPWAGAAVEMATTFVATADELAELVADLQAVIEAWHDRVEGRDGTEPGTSPVELQLRAFPRSIPAATPTAPHGAATTEHRSQP
ncbi:winged helix-turn-helix domain-containing protein [Georgenia muralis]|uniref:Helix-turn-helix protein n=1 Tax=Georgenia muralis TaxID=154117 RepID=A0A3N4Z8Q7_9MICO|nr:winged helix-turn-helix domain-containing protein [Georgenia muralis]RPF28657.1 helix-turn-helix protein [Georgenia muralis]